MNPRLSSGRELPFLTLCFFQAGQVRVLTELFEDQLREEFAFDKESVRSWETFLPLLKAASEPLEWTLRHHADRLDKETLASWGAYLVFYQTHVEAAEDVLAGRPIKRQDLRPKYVQADSADFGRRISDALSWILRGRYSLIHWQRDLARQAQAEGMKPEADYADLPCWEQTKVMGNGQELFKRALQKLYEAPHLNRERACHRASQWAFLTVYFMATTQPLLFENAHARAEEAHANLLRHLGPGSENTGIHQRLYALRELNLVTYPRRVLKI